MDSSLHLVPGRYKLPTAPGGSLRWDSRGWENAEVKFTATSACVCVCVSCVATLYMHVCVAVCRCATMKLTEVSLVFFFLCVMIMPTTLNWNEGGLMKKAGFISNRSHNLIYFGCQENREHGFSLTL